MTERSSCLWMIIFHLNHQLNIVYAERLDTSLLNEKQVYFTQCIEYSISILLSKIPSKTTKKPKFITSIPHTARCHTSQSGKLENILLFHFSHLLTAILYTVKATHQLVCTLNHIFLTS